MTDVLDRLLNALSGSREPTSQLYRDAYIEILGLREGKAKLSACMRRSTVSLEASTAEVLDLRSKLDSIAGVIRLARLNLLACLEFIDAQTISAGVTCTDPQCRYADEEHQHPARQGVPGISWGQFRKAWTIKPAPDVNAHSVDEATGFLIDDLGRWRVCRDRTCSDAASPHYRTSACAQKDQPPRSWATVRDADDPPPGHPDWVQPNPPSRKVKDNPQA